MVYTCISVSISIPISRVPSVSGNHGSGTKKSVSGNMKRVSGNQEARIGNKEACVGNKEARVGD